MSSTVVRPALLRLVCAALPAPEAEAVRKLDPRDPATWDAARDAVRRTGVALPPELSALFAGQEVV